MALLSHTPIHTKRQRTTDVVEDVMDCFLELGQRDRVTPSASTVNQDGKLSRMSDLIEQLSNLVDGVNGKLIREVLNLRDEIVNLNGHNLKTQADTTYIKLNQEISNLRGEVNKLNSTNDGLRTDITRLSQTCDRLTAHVELLTGQDHNTVDMSTVAEKSTDNAKTNATAIGTKYTTITNNTVLNSVDEMLVLHDKLKDKMITNLRKFSDHDLKNNTRTEQEYQEFRDIRKNLNKWYVSGQLVKKNMASTDQIDSNHYLSVQWKYSQAVIKDAKLKQVDTGLKESIVQSDLTLKLASLESNIALMDKLDKSFSEGTRDLIYAKAFKNVIRSHKNLNDNMLFRRRNNQHTNRSKPSYRARNVAREDIIPPRHSEHYDKEFPSLDGKTHWEDDDEIFDRRLQYEHKPVRRTYHRSSHYQHRPQYDSYLEPEYDEYDPKSFRYPGDAMQTHLQSRRNSHYGRRRQDSFYEPRSVTEETYCY